MEIPKRIKVDIDNKRLYAAIEINKNKYNDRTVYAPGDLPPTDNSNVAIVSYTWDYGVREWVTVLGDKYYSDYFLDFDVYGNSLYVILNSYTTTYASDASYTDIYYYRLR